MKLIRLYLIFSIVFCCINPVCSAELDSNHVYYIVKIDKKSGEVISLNSGYLKGNVFVKHGTCWEYMKIKFNESVSKKKFHNGKKEGSNQYISRNGFKKPLARLFGKIQSNPAEITKIESDFWKFLKESMLH